jgi:lysophospholipase L1-like esterase
LKSKLRKIAAATISSFICVSVLWGADLYLHRKHGVNIWGYRGPALGSKQFGEKRVAVLGGSTTWGFGLQAGQDFPAQLERLLADDKAANIKVLNLGFNSEGAYSFTQTLSDYDYLGADLVIFYSGYNDLGPNYYNFRHRTPLFAWTGYLPLLPSLTIDKITTLRQRDTKVVFTPPHLEGRDDAARLRQQLKELELKTTTSERPATSSCSSRWQFYCERIIAATDLALQKGKRVIVAGEPYINGEHLEQQFELKRALVARFGSEPRVRYLDLGDVIDLRDPSLCWDGMHLTEEGNRRIAAALRQPTWEMLR